MIKAVIFDVDGVLVDSYEANIDFLRALMKKGGYTITREDLLTRDTLHLPVKKTIEKFVGADNRDEIQRIFEMMNDEGLYNEDMLIFPENLEMVLKSLYKSYKLAIVTSRIRSGVDDIFRLRNIGDLFDVIVPFEDYSNPKPHPEPLILALKKLNLNADEAVYIGDSPSDIEAAKAAGMKSIYLSPNQHEHATLRISNFDDLPIVIDKLSS